MRQSFFNKLKYTLKKGIKGSNDETIDNSAVNIYNFIDLYILYLLIFVEL